MRLLYILALVICVSAARDVSAQPPPGSTLAESCGQLGVADACAIIAEAATLLSPTYEANKARDAERRLRMRGYAAEYYPADTTLHRPTTDLFLISRPGTNRLYVVITGTEGWLDWVSNARFANYTGVYRHGEFYVPPGHAGFRGGVIDIIRDDILRASEFDAGPLDCAARPPRGRSRIAEFLCRAGLPTGPGSVQTIIVGHSRGVGIGLLAATAVAGLQVRIEEQGPARGQARVAPQRYWPLRLHAVIGFAPPQAVSQFTDSEAGREAPPGLPSHREVFAELGIPSRTIMFLNERDIVPLLGLGRAEQYGHRYRIRRDRGIVYEGNVWPQDRGLIEAHSSAGYCVDVIRALGPQAPSEEGWCDPRDPSPRPDPLPPVPAAEPAAPRMP